MRQPVRSFAAWAALMSDTAIVSSEIITKSEDEAVEWLHANRCTDGLPVVRYCQYLWMGCCPFSADLRRRRVFVIGSDARCSLRAVAGPALVAAA
jgi:hypothetical protein